MWKNYSSSTQRAGCRKCGPVIRHRGCGAVLRSLLPPITLFSSLPHYSPLDELNKGFDQCNPFFPSSQFSRAFSWDTSHPLSFLVLPATARAEILFPLCLLSPRTCWSLLRNCVSFCGRTHKQVSFRGFCLGSGRRVAALAR